MPKFPVRFKDLLKALKPYGVKVKKGGKGSETILLRPLSKGSTKGPQHTIKKHGKNAEISCRVIEALLESLDIPEEAVWHHWYIWTRPRTAHNLSVILAPIAGVTRNVQCTLIKSNDRKHSSHYVLFQTIPVKKVVGFWLLSRWQKSKESRINGRYIRNRFHPI